MNRLLSSLLFMFVLMEYGCTQNNGYIGPIFGSWALVEISENGVPLELTGETVFSFQNEVVQVDHILSEFDRFWRFGNFTISGDILSMKFLTEPSSDGKGHDFLMPTWLYFPDGVMPLRFDILILNGGHMVLSIDNCGKTNVYTFSRTW